MNAISVLLTVTWPLFMTNIVLRLLKSKPDRDLVLPAPYMLLVVLRVGLDETVSRYMLAVLVAPLLVLLYSCRQQRRDIARMATIACCSIAIGLQMSLVWPIKP